VLAAAAEEGRREVLPGASHAFEHARPEAAPRLHQGKGALQEGYVRTGKPVVLDLRLYVPCGAPLSSCR